MIRIKLKEDTKLTLILVASMLAVLLLLLQFVGIGPNWSILGKAVGPRTLDSPICLWGRGDNVQLIYDARFCNRLFSRYASDGTCYYQPGVVPVNDRKIGSVNFVYEGYCSSPGAQVENSIYSGHIE